MTSKQWASRLYSTAIKRAAGQDGASFYARKINGEPVRTTHEFTLTVDWIKQRIDLGLCQATGMQFDLTRRTGRRGPGNNPFAPSIDRIDNEAGYTPDNVRIVVQIYNVATGRFPIEAFHKLVRHVYMQLPYENPVAASRRDLFDHLPEGSY